MLLFSEEAGGICVGASAGKFGVGALEAVWTHELPNSQPMYSQVSSLKIPILYLKMILSVPPASLNNTGPGVSFGPAASGRWLPSHGAVLGRGASPDPCGCMWSCSLRPGIRGLCSLKGAKHGMFWSVLPVGNNPWYLLSSVQHLGAIWKPSA